MIGNGPWWAWVILAAMWASCLGALIWANRADTREWREYRDWHATHDALGRIREDVDVDAR